MNTIKISFLGTEFDYCGIKSDGMMDFEKDYCGMVCNDEIYDLDIEVNYQNINTDKVSTYCDGTKDWEFGKDIVGVRMFENKAHYYCEIETDEEFDIYKLELNIYNCLPIAGSDIIDAYAHILMFSTISYNNVEYKLKYGPTSCKSTDLVWGSDPMMEKIKKRTIRRLINILDCIEEDEEQYSAKPNIAPEETKDGDKDE
jgi:hypothetical protein